MTLLGHRLSPPVLLAVWLVLALVLRLSLAVPTPPFSLVWYQATFFMPVASAMSMGALTWASLRGVIPTERVLLVLVLGSGPVLLVYAATTGHLEFVASSAAACVVTGLCALLLYRRRASLTYQVSRVGPNLAAGLVVGLAVCGVFALVVVATGGRLALDNAVPKLVSGVVVFAMMLFLAPVWEEPVFRGWLVWFPVRPRVVLVGLVGLQAAVFWLAHAYYAASRPYDFFLLVPLCGVAFALVVLKTQRLTSALVAHAFVNAYYVSFVQY